MSKLGKVAGAIAVAVTVGSNLVNPPTTPQVQAEKVATVQIKNTSVNAGKQAREAASDANKAQAKGKQGK